MKQRMSAQRPVGPRPDAAGHKHGTFAPPSTAGRGERLDSRTRAALEPRFGHDFSEVRIHTDAQSRAAARSRDAAALAVGSDIYFAEGRYDPDSATGFHLLAHELTHVAQAGHSGRSASRPESKTADSSESEARNAADRVVLGLPVSGLSATPAAVSMEGEEENKGGWMDRAFGLNPNRSFVESGMNALGYGPTGIWGRPRGENEGDNIHPTDLTLKQLWLLMRGRGKGSSTIYQRLAALQAEGKLGED